MRKYAIYRGETGLYEKEYIDTEEGYQELYGRDIGHNRLPIVVNRVGGMCSFEPVEDNFVGIVEVDDNQDPLTREQKYPKNSPDFYFGWISPDGDTYNCGHEGHLDCADMICEELGVHAYNGERYLEEHGWAKTLRETPYTPDNMRTRRVWAKNLYITKKQADALYDAGLYDTWDVRIMVKESQGRW